MTAPSLLNDQTRAALFESLRAAPHWMVGFSGGLDSTVLLHLCHAYLNQLQSAEQPTEREPPKLSALHIDHQLMPDHRDWTEHCEAFCSAYAIPLTVAVVEVEPDGRGLEQAARTARYEAFAQAMHPAGTVVLLAHHQNDQAETLLLRLFRGSGIRGAAAMQAQRAFAQGRLARPLLDVPRSELESYARHFSLEYTEDPSNSDEALDRNYVRRRVLPVIEQRWPAANKVIARFAKHAGDNERLLGELAAIDFAGVSSGPAKYGEHLRIAGLVKLADYRRANLYRYWLNKYGWQMPSAERLAQIDQLACNNRAASTLIFNGHSIRVHDDGLYCVSDEYLAALGSGFARRIDWNGESSLDISEFVDLNIFTDKSSSDLNGLVCGHYTIGARRQGAIGQVNGHSKTIKKILQQASVPEWLRDIYPIVYHATGSNETIAAVGDICICDGFRGGNRLQLVWRLPDTTHLDKSCIS